MEGHLPSRRDDPHRACRRPDRQHGHRSVHEGHPLIAALSRAPRDSHALYAALRELRQAARQGHAPTTTRHDLRRSGRVVGERHRGRSMAPQRRACAAACFASATCRTSPGKTHRRRPTAGSDATPSRRRGQTSTFSPRSRSAQACSCSWKSSDSASEPRRRAARFGRSPEAGNSALACWAGFLGFQPRPSLMISPSCARSGSTRYR